MRVRVVPSEHMTMIRVAPLLIDGAGKGDQIIKWAVDFLGTVWGPEIWGTKPLPEDHFWRLWGVC